MSQHSVYAFTGFTLDTRRRSLVSRPNGQAVPLPTTAFDTLLYLVEHAGALVEKQALMQAVWPHVTVEENSLSQSISALRRALGEDRSQHRFIVTVPGRGYRFTAEVTRQGGDTPAVPPNPDVYQNYVAGWWALTRPAGSNLADGLQHLERAVALDPNFALAHACIGDCYIMFGVHGHRRPLETIPKARAAVLRALEIDSGLAEAHTTLGHIHMVFDFDHARARAKFAHALELNPRCFVAYRGQGLLLLARGEFDAALAAFRQAQAIEPLALHINNNIGMVYFQSGRYAQAVEQYELTLKMEPGYDVARSILSHSLMRLGEIARASEMFAGRTDTTSRHAVDRATLYALSGRAGEARAILQSLLLSAEERYVSPMDIAVICADLEDDEAALDWLERAVEQRVFNFVKTDPAFLRLHGQPRFNRILERYGLG
jgi:DNA-binding winged helix-turn-helix (wHTH) protein/Tfp pilus assembly protein PilF